MKPQRLELQAPDALRCPPAALPAHVVERLRAHLPARFDFASVRLQARLPRWARRNVRALVFRNTIYFAPGCYDADTLEGLALIAHEIAHVEQFRRLGAVAFVCRYLGSYAWSRLRGRGRQAAYMDIGFERSARDFAARVVSELARSPSRAPSTTAASRGGYDERGSTPEPTSNGPPLAI